MWIANDAMLLVFDPKAARTLLKTYTFRKFPKLIKKHFDAQTSGGNNIIMMNDKEWRLYRNAMHRGMTKSSMESYQFSMCQCSALLVNSWKNKISMEGDLHENIHRGSC